MTTAENRAASARSLGTYRHEGLELTDAGGEVGITSDVVHAQLGDRWDLGGGMLTRSSGRRCRVCGSLDSAIVAAAVVLRGPPPLKDGLGH